MTENVPQPSSQQEQKPSYSLRINGKSALPNEAKRILSAPATPPDKDDRATKPIETMSRGFNLMR
jgi:hypothetical protein